MWKEELAQLLPLLGHRNWIAVVDKAFPLQCSEGIITRYVDESIEVVFSAVLDMINKSDHIKPVVYTDLELGSMDDFLSQGVEALKQHYSSILNGIKPEVIPHDEIFEKFEQAAKFFRLYVIKTNCLIPYSSIFINLDCGYWNPQCETILRNKLNK